MKKSEGYLIDDLDWLVLRILEFTLGYYLAILVLVWHHESKENNINMNRLALLAEQIKGKDSLSITDSRTGKTSELPIKNSHIKSTDLSKLTYKGKVLRSYDPGYMNTITCTSKISFIDGDKGIL